jgi:two-component SAPR family response regulator
MKRERRLNNGKFISNKALNLFFLFVDCRKQAASEERVIRKRVQSSNKQERRPSSADLS